MFGQFFKKGKQKVADKEEPTQSSASGSSFSNLNAEKLKAVIISLNQAEPIFEKAGYMMEKLTVEFGHESKLTPQFKRINLISEDEQNELLASLEDKQLIKFVIISLYKSSKIQSLFKDSALFYYGMEIDISSVPSVKTIFKRKETNPNVIPFPPSN